MLFSWLQWNKTKNMNTGKSYLLNLGAQIRFNYNSGYLTANEKSIGCLLLFASNAKIWYEYMSLFYSKKQKHPHHLKYMVLLFIAGLLQQ